MAIELEASIRSTEGFARTIVSSEKLAATYIVEDHRIGIGQLDPAAAGQSHSDSGLAGIEQRDEPVPGVGVVAQVEGQVAGVEALLTRMELHPILTVVRREIMDEWDRSGGVERVD